MTLFGKGPPRDKPRDRYRQGAQCDQDNFQIESAHAPLVRLRPTDLGALRWSVFRRTHQSASFHMSLLTGEKTQTKQQSLPVGKQICRRSLKR
jgi:hypothetical protein